MGCSNSSHARTSNTFHSRFALGDKLGEGSFGQVYSATERTTGIEHAVKVVEAGSGTTSLKMTRESNILRQVGHHKHVVALHCFFNESTASYLVMERCQQSLSDALKQTERQFQEGVLMDSFHQILLALHHCHSKFIAHRDVTPSNMLVGFDGAVKLCDFGSAVAMPLEGIRGTAGSIAFMSPEMVRGEHYDCKTDVWSCGVAAYFFLYGKYPYQPRTKPRLSESSMKQQTKDSIATNMPEPNFTPIDGMPEPSACASKFARSLLVRDAEQRPDACECALMVAAGAKFHKVFRRISTKKDNDKKIENTWSAQAPSAAGFSTTGDDDVDNLSSKASTELLSRQSSVESSVAPFGASEESAPIVRSLLSL